MNSNIRLLLEDEYGLSRNFTAFMKLIEIGIINKDTAFDAVIEYKNPEYIYLFARDIEGANIQKLEDEIIQIDRVRYIYNFARYVKGANIPRLEDAMCKSQDANIEKAHYIYLFAGYIKDANIDKLCDAICETQDFWPIFSFARDINGANIEKLEDAVIQFGLANGVETFARYVKGANIEKLEQAKKSIEKIEEIKGIKIDIRDLLSELEREEYDYISKHKQVYAQFFIDDTKTKGRN